MPATPSSSTKTALSTTTALSGSPEVKTVLTAQPSMANTNVASDSSDPLTSASNAQIRPPISANIRFTVALAVLITQGMAQLLCQSWLSSPSTVTHGIAVLFNIFLAGFCSEWIRIHSFALTRQKRAFFDEANILETYQPRARTHGHLFQPDPPTPGPVVKVVDDPNLPERTPNEKAAFNANRDAHYANMFEYALRVAKEAEESDRMALDAQKARLAKEKEGGAAPPNKSPSSVPPGEPLYEELPAVPPVISPPTDPGIPLQLPSSLIEKGEDSMKLEDTSKTVSDTSSSDGSTTATGTTVTVQSRTNGSKTSGASSVSSVVKSKTSGSVSSPASKTGQKRKKKPKH